MKTFLYRLVWKAIWRYRAIDNKTWHSDVVGRTLYKLSGILIPTDWLGTEVLDATH